MKENQQVIAKTITGDPQRGVRGSPCDKEWECMNYFIRKRKILIKEENN